jgi:hypothetical protein
MSGISKETPETCTRIKAKSNPVKRTWREVIDLNAFSTGSQDSQECATTGQKPKGQPKLRTQSQSAVHIDTATDGKRKEISPLVMLYGLQTPEERAKQENNITLGELPVKRTHSQSAGSVDPVTDGANKDATTNESNSDEEIPDELEYSFSRTEEEANKWKLKTLIMSMTRMNISTRDNKLISVYDVIQDLIRFVKDSLKGSLKDFTIVKYKAPVYTRNQWAFLQKCFETVIQNLHHDIIDTVKQNKHMSCIIIPAEPRVLKILRFLYDQDTSTFKVALIRVDNTPFQSDWPGTACNPVATYYDNFPGYKDRDGQESLLTKITNHFKVEISTVRLWSEAILATKDP